MEVNIIKGESQIIFEREERMCVIVFRFKTMADAESFKVSKHIDQNIWRAVTEISHGMKKRYKGEIIQRVISKEENKSGWKYFKLAQNKFI